MALRLDSNVRDPIPYYMLMLDRVRERADDSTSCISTSTSSIFRCSGRIANRTVTTLHGRQDLPDLKPLYVGFSDMPLVSISERPAHADAGSNFVATVHHGLPSNLLKPTYKPRGGYLAFLGRISPEKRPDRAIEIAGRSACR